MHFGITSRRHLSQPEEHQTSSQHLPPRQRRSCVQELQNNFKVPVLAALGNNDSSCGDYQIPPNSPFLAATGGSISRARRLARSEKHISIRRILFRPSSDRRQSGHHRSEHHILVHFVQKLHPNQRRSRRSRDRVARLEALYRQAAPSRCHARDAHSAGHGRL